MKTIYLGNNAVQNQTKKIEGSFVEIEKERFYKISNYNQMPDFFMTIVSDSDHWMYISSNGSLSAGRKNRNNALFPYYTVDKIHDYKDKTGSKTICLVEKNGKTFLWEPFTNEAEKIYSVERNLYKSIYGNKIIFEEINKDLELSFRYGWYNSEKFGWIKKSFLENRSVSNLAVNIIDGLQNILPSGVDYQFQNEFSNLLDAYKKNELLEESKLGLFQLSSIPVDRAEPSEALKTNTVWLVDAQKNSTILLSTNQLDNFRRGVLPKTETDIRAARGAYFFHSEILLKEKETNEWSFVAEINQDSTNVANLNQFLQQNKQLKNLIDADIKNGTTNLKKIVGNADGLQVGNEELTSARHFSNTLFNVMRGGIFTDNYTVEATDFKLFLAQTNRELKKQLNAEINQIPTKLTYSELIEWAQQTQNTDLERICFEYLPLTFSRRHGDPSRPWNQFSIEIKNNDGSNKLNYEGNWRDIFQNWEALSLSFPEYLEGMICKFLNASTADGYNPYRITREGIDWESPNPNEPWAYIGYWGDHQIIYLQKFLELSDNFHPGLLDDFLTKEIFVYANVPYRIKPYREIEKNPKDTIDFDFELNKKIENKAQTIGADARLIHTSEESIYKVNMAEKILVSLLAKLSNFIPEAGIWLNTQRPEWNDANNALVGNGVSMVTLYYLRRFLKFWETKLKNTNVESFRISEEVYALFFQIFDVFNQHKANIESGFSTKERYLFTRNLGEAGSKYRESIYSDSFSGEKIDLQNKTLVEFIHLSLKYIEQSIQKNKRSDGLYHAYNLISIKNESISIRYLYEMLEGQVAVLSSGYLSGKESLEVLDALKSSRLFRADQYCYILYPDRQLPRFNEKNKLSAEQVNKSKLLQTLLEQNNSEIIKKDIAGDFHFNSNFKNAAFLERALNQLNDEKFGDLVTQEKELILNLYEEIFDHQSFTGRSGTFYGYEGLGSIYWHMVSKLLLATQECFFQALAQHANSEILGRLKNHYYEIKAGIGVYKSPELYGAFPTDAYSHTPGNAGAKQPGLTGQVKEDVISRFGELGIQVKNGKIVFDTSLLNTNEILSKKERFRFFDLEGKEQNIELNEQQLACTFCQVPILLNFGEKEKIKVSFSTGKVEEYTGNELPEELSSALFKRNKFINRVEFYSKYH